MSSKEKATFSPRTVFILVLVGLLGFVGLGVLGAYGPELEAANVGGATAISRSAVGFAGLVQLLRSTGALVVISHAKSTGRTHQPALLIIAPPPGAPEKEVLALAKGRPTLVVMPKWIMMTDVTHPGWATRLGAFPAEVVVSPLRDRLTSVTRRTGVGVVQLRDVGDATMAALGPIRVDSLQTATAGDGALPLIQDQAGRPVLLLLSPGLYLLTDPDLLDNAGMASLPTARAALKIITELKSDEGPIIFDTTLNGLTKPRTLLGLALSPPFLGASLCGLGVALLMGLHAIVRFGPTRNVAPPLALGKAALLDNSAMLIRLARREPKMGRRYAALIRRLLARRVLAGGAASAELDTRRLDEALDRLSPADGAPFSTLASDAEAASSTAALVTAARRLHDFTMEVLGERR